VSRQLQIRSVVDQVHADLLERIVAGELPAGSRLRQEALAAELGVSRTPLREALARLVSEGLVELVPNRGATVARRDHADMEQAWRARLALRG
jgi:DNA-binding GntR family transcriptional regulator